ncbi:MAG: NADH-quinone oxidoreductase subunit NuoB [Nitrospiraceae bacterium]|nr:MAG: NADH-quinone oxidoreductase subunit NuoB [Nitrospiraceae bacterium]
MIKEIFKNLAAGKNVISKADLPALSAEEEKKLIDLQKGIDRIFGKSLRIRQVDAGSCNACEWECTALTNPVYDIQRFGIDFVASPRHADLILVTGPVSRQMELALKKTYLATPEPRIVVACGDCTIDGGVYKGSYAVTNGVANVIPVDYYIPGCPPSPGDLLSGFLKLLVTITK